MIPAFGIWDSLVLHARETWGEGSRKYTDHDVHSTVLFKREFEEGYLVIPADYVAFDGRGFSLVKTGIQNLGRLAA